MLRTFCLAFATCLSVLSVHAAEFTVTKHDGGVRIDLDGKLFTEYLINNGPKPILWPLIGPGGQKLTRDFPMAKVDGETKDHPHHRSLWFTHGDVNGVDFWSEVKNHGRTVHREFVEVAGGPTAVIRTRNDWIGPDDKKQLEDERTVTFGVDGDVRWIDFDIVLKAGDTPVTFGDTKEGSFGVRVPSVMDVDRKQGGHIVNSEGLKDKETWGKAAAWVDYHGPVEGKVVGLAILNHPSSFRYPTPWHVRTYGLFAANPFGLHDFNGKQGPAGTHKLAPGETLKLSYRVILHNGDEKEAKLAERFAEYAKSEKK